MVCPGQGQATAPTRGYGKTLSFSGTFVDYALGIVDRLLLSNVLSVNLTAIKRKDIVIVLKGVVRSASGLVVLKSVNRVYNVLGRPSVVVAGIYLIFITLLTLIHHYSMIDYVHIGTLFARRDPHGTIGYDGQFYYFLARDPWHAHQYMDNAPYRYQRIVYGLLVYIVSLGQASLIPFLLLFVNFLSIVLSVEIVARLLAQRNLSPWFSLPLGLYFGQATAFIFDTTEPLTIALLCIGLWYLERKRITTSAVFMGLAALSRETAILFPLVYAISFLWQQRWLDVARFLVLAILPMFVWYVVIWVIFGQTGLTYAPAFEPIPFGGIFAFLSSPLYFWSLIGLMFIPTVGGWFFVLREVFYQHWGNSAFFIWGLNLILVTFMSVLSYQEYVSSGRISTTLILATLLYAWSSANRTLLRVAQYYALTFPFYAIGVMLIRFVPT